MRGIEWVLGFVVFNIVGTPGPTRTGDLRIRSPALYPAELRARNIVISNLVQKVDPKDLCSLDKESTGGMLECWNDVEEKRAGSLQENQTQHSCTPILHHSTVPTASIGGDIYKMG